MGSCNRPASQLPKLLSIPNCLNPLGFSSQANQIPKIPHRFSRPEALFISRVLPQLSPFQTHPWGERSPPALQEGPGGLQLQAGMGVCKGKQGLGRKVPKG